MATKKVKAKSFMSNKTYDILKYICQVVFPAVIFLWATISAIWGFPLADEVEKTITAIMVFMEMLLGLTVSRASATYNKKNKR